MTIRLVISAKDAKKLKLRTTLASAKGQGGRTLRLRVSKKVAKVLARLKSVRAKLVVSAVAPDGRKAGLSKPVTLRR